MKIVFLIAGAIFMLTGLVVSLMANKHRNPGASKIPSFNPVHWFQPWKIPDWFTSTGVCSDNS